MKNVFEKIKKFFMWIGVAFAAVVGVLVGIFTVSRTGKDKTDYKRMPKKDDTGSTVYGVVDRMRARRDQMQSTTTEINGTIGNLRNIIEENKRAVTEHNRRIKERRERALAFTKKMGRGKETK